MFERGIIQLLAGLENGCKQEAFGYSWGETSG